MKDGDGIKDYFQSHSDINRTIVNNESYPTPAIPYEDNYVLDLDDLTIQLTSVGPLLPKVIQ